MFILALAAKLLLGPPETCIGSVFGGPNDNYAGGDALLLDRPVELDDSGIAHRTRPLGSRVIVALGFRAVAVRVIDRGPYGADLDGSWRIKKRVSEPGKWRGCVDLAPATARALGHDGWEQVEIYSVPGFLEGI